MSLDNLNLAELQQSVIGIPNDLIVPECNRDIQREAKIKSIKKIVDMFTVSRKNNRVYNHTYTSLGDESPFIRSAAADVIGEIGNKNSFIYLFNALEDEDNVAVRQRIVAAIDILESRISGKPAPLKTKSSTMKSMRILSYQP